VPSDELLFKVNTHTFSFPEIHENTFSVTELESGKFLPADPKNLPKFKTILLADYLTEPTSEWIEVAALKLDASDCYYLAENKIKAESNKDFTPQYALEKLASKNLPPKSISDLVTFESLSVISSPNQSDASAISQKNNFVSRWIFALVILVLLALALYTKKILKK
jgi:hypothetical protein